MPSNELIDSESAALADLAGRGKARIIQAGLTPKEKLPNGGKIQTIIIIRRDRKAQ